jgi:photosystem II stability/assembly factor-like uncharacterized protein
MAVPVAFLAVALSGTASEVNVWTSIGPEGGAVSALAADPRNPATLYAATGAGIFKTTDGGANWNILNSDAGTPFDFVAIDSAGTLYAVEPGMYGLDDYFKSTDGGASWSAISFGAAGVCRGLVVDSVHPGTLYAVGGYAHGVCRSTDGGATWTLVNAKVGLGGNTDLLLLLAPDPFDARTLYAATAFGFYKSTNGGVSWSLANSGLPQVTDFAVGLRDRGLALDPQNPGTLYYGRLGRIFKSTDGAATWNDAGSGLPPAAANGWSAVGSIVVDPQNTASMYAVITQDLPGPPPDQIFPAPFLLVTSSDGGASWITATDPTLLVSPVPGDARNGITSIAPDPLDPNTLYLGTAKGVLKSTDGGGHWNFANSGLKAAGGMWQVLIDAQSPSILAPPYKSTDGGATWSRYAPPRGLGGLTADPQNPHILYGTTGQAFYKSADFGNSWTQIGAFPGNSGQFVISRRFPDIMYGVGRSVDGDVPSLFKSADGGHTWSASALRLNGEPAVWIAVDPQDPDIIYISTSLPDLEAVYLSLWKSADGGVSWTRLRGANATFSYGPILLDPQNPGTIYFADTDRGQNSSSIYYSDTQWHKSTDGGATWTEIFPSCGQPSVVPLLLTTLLIDPQNPGTLYAGVSGGVEGAVCRSTDGGANWTVVGPGLTGGVQALALAPRDSRTLYATMPAGLFVITLPPE